MSARARKERNLGLAGIYYLIAEPIISEVQPLVLKTVSTKSLEPFLTFLRYLRYILRPNSYCSVCGRKVRECWKPIFEYFVDPIGTEKTKPFDPIHIGCRLCEPFFQCFDNLEKRRVYYII